MPGVTRVHGRALPESFFGMQPQFYKIAASDISFTATTVGSNFEQAVRAIETVASITVLGTPGAAGFMVGVDGNSFGGRKVNGVDVASTTTLINAIQTFTTSTSTTVTPMSISGVTFV